MELIIIIGLILLNGIFAMSEMSLISSRKFKLENLKKKGSSNAKIALDLSENPTKFLSTVQIGITLISILLGVFSGDTLTLHIQTFLNQFAFLLPYSKQLSVFIMVLFITYLSIVFGELFPKRLGMTFPEKIATQIAKPMYIISKIVSPFVWLLTFTNDLLLSLFRIKKTTDSKVSEEEIKSIIKESAEGGEIQDIEQNIVERVFELGDRKVNSLYTHRSDLVYFNLTDTWEEVLNKINTEKHSAYPVCKEDDIDNVIGLVLLKDLFIFNLNNAYDIQQVIKQPVFITENSAAYKVLEQFKNEKMHYGIVIDEYGTTKGMVTMDDVVDALVGNVTELDQNEYQITQRTPNSWLVDGQFSVLDFLKEFNLNLDFNLNENYNTVAGLIIEMNGTLPNVGQKVFLDNYELEIVDKDGQRIDKILVTKLN